MVELPTAHRDAPPIVSADDLIALQSDPATASSIAILDVRWYLDGRDGYAAYRDGHISGARFVDMDSVLAAPASAEDGRHPLPSPEVFAAGLGRLGVADSHHVVAYDDLGGMVAGRLVWMLRIIGRPASLLDGGLQAWPSPLDQEVPSVDPVDRTPVPWPPSALATADEVAAAIGAGVTVIDSRAPERYRGDTEPVDPRAGHIPGAINLPFADNLDQGRFRPREQLRHRFASAGSNPIFYCGSGVSACHNILAMEAAGLPRPRLYVGSWSQWANDNTRPTATAGTDQLAPTTPAADQPGPTTPGTGA